jgi:hypothetical protein
LTEERLAESLRRLEAFERRVGPPALLSAAGLCAALDRPEHQALARRLAEA